MTMYYGLNHWATLASFCCYDSNENAGFVFKRTDLTANWNLDVHPPTQLDLIFKAQDLYKNGITNKAGALIRVTSDVQNPNIDYSGIMNIYTNKLYHYGIISAICCSSTSNSYISNVSTAIDEISTKYKANETNTNNTYDAYISCKAIPSLQNPNYTRNGCGTIGIEGVVVDIGNFAD